MSDRLLKILAGILAFFLVAWIAARLISGGGGGEPAPYALEAAAELDLDSMVVTAVQDTIHLRRGASGWTVNGREAIADAGEALKSALEGAAVGQLASRNPDNHARLGVTADSGHVVRIYANGESQFELIVGERAELFDRAYVRRPDDVEVFTLQGTLVNLVRRSVDDWRNREILSAARGDIQRIEYAYGDTSFAVVRDSAAWRVEPSDAPVPEGAMTPVLTNLSQLRAIGFAPDSVTDTLTWESPTARVRVLGPGDAPIAELEFLRREENVGYYVRRGMGTTVFTLSSFSGDQLLKREDELREAGGQ